METFQSFLAFQTCFNVRSYVECSPKYVINFYPIPSQQRSEISRTFVWPYSQPARTTIMQFRVVHHMSAILKTSSVRGGVRGHYLLLILTLNARSYPVSPRPGNSRDCHKELGFQTLLLSRCQQTTLRKTFKCGCECRPIRADLLQEFTSAITQIKRQE